MADKKFNETYVIEGEVYWAKVYEADENNKYSLEMSLNEESQALIEKLGIPIKTSKNDPDRPPFVKMERYAGFEGEVKPMKIVDGSLNKFEELIGNGSRCRVEFFAKHWQYPKNRPTKSGYKAYMLTLQVIDHIPYVPKANPSKIDVVEPASETNRFSKKA